MRSRPFRLPRRSHTAPTEGFADHSASTGSEHLGGAHHAARIGAKATIELFEGQRLGHARVGDEGFGLEVIRRADRRHSSSIGHVSVDRTCGPIEASRSSNGRRRWVTSTPGSSKRSVESQHRALRGAGLVRTSRRGREVVYELTDVHAAHIVRAAVAHASEAAWERNPLSPLPQGRRIRNVSAAWTDVPAEF